MLSFKANKSFGQLIREYREAQGLSLKRVATVLGIDQVILQKIELGQRNISESQIIPLANLLNIDESQLLTAFQVEQILRVVRFDSIGLAAIQIVETEVKTYVHKNAHKSYQLEKMRSVFRNFQRVTKAYIYDLAEKADGTTDTSALCFAIELDRSQTTAYSLTDLQRSLKITLNKNVDVEHLELFKPVAAESVFSELELVYQK
jgi:HTH-type transcriptional regulator, competence development regulator